MNLDIIDGFNNSVTRITIIVIMTLYVLTMFTTIFKSKKDTQWPPFGMSCPDYWTSRKATINGEDGYICTSDPKNKNLAQTIINNDYVYYYPSGSKTTVFTRGSPLKNIDYKKQWANESGIAWDGAEA